jgi:ribosomal protein L37AE/L43A
MGTKRKAHPDHYQTQPIPAHEPELQKSEYVKLKSAREPPHRPGRGERHRVRAGEHLGHTATLRCEKCGAEVVRLAGQTVGACSTCQGELFHALA